MPSWPREYSLGVAAASGLAVVLALVWSWPAAGSGRREAGGGAPGARRRSGGEKASRRSSPEGRRGSGEAAGEAAARPKEAPAAAPRPGETAPERGAAERAKPLALAETTGTAVSSASLAGLGGLPPSFGAWPSPAGLLPGAPHGPAAGVWAAPPKSPKPLMSPNEKRDLDMMFRHQERQGGRGKLSSAELAGRKVRRSKKQQGKPREASCHGELVVAEEEGLREALLLELLSPEAPLASPGAAARRAKRKARRRAKPADVAEAEALAAKDAPGEQQEEDEEEEEGVPEGARSAAECEEKQQEENDAQQEEEEADDEDEHAEVADAECEEDDGEEEKDDEDLAAAEEYDEDEEEEDADGAALAEAEDEAESDVDGDVDEADEEGTNGADEDHASGGCREGGSQVAAARDLKAVSCGASAQSNAAGPSRCSSSSTEEGGSSVEAFPTAARRTSSPPDAETPADAETPEADAAEVDQQAAGTPSAAGPVGGLVPKRQRAWADLMDSSDDEPQAPCAGGLLAAAPCSIQGAPVHSGPPRHRSAGSGRRASGPRAEEREAPCEKGYIWGGATPLPQPGCQAVPAFSGQLNPLAPEFVPSSALLRQVHGNQQSELFSRSRAGRPSSPAQRRRSPLAAQRAAAQPKPVEAEWVEVTRRRAVRKADAGKL